MRSVARKQGGLAFEIDEALESWEHRGEDCDVDGNHSDECIDSAFSDGYQVGRQSVLAAADRDRQFAEFVRKLSDVERDSEFIPLRRFIDTINAEYWSLYGRPCTATATSDEKEKVR